MSAWSFILLSLFVASSNAANDWSTPCFAGSCQYDLPASNGSASGTVMIWGSANSISDITPAAGWEIIGCSPDALKQDIRLVCKDGSAASCDHLFDGTTNAASAVGKVVRLPENCGKSAFAVVTKSYIPQDQSIPASVASALSRRDGKTPTVRGLSLDTTFSGTPSSGPVNFAVRAANVPGANGDLSSVPQQQRRSNSRFMRRGVSDFVNNAVSAISSLNTFNVNNSKALTPVDIDKTFNLIDTTISCPPVTAGVNVNVGTQIHATASIGVAAAGTIVPPEVTSFGLLVGFSADLGGSVDFQVNATGSVDSGEIKLFEVGIPGLDIPGIITLGPSFELNGQVEATIDELSVDMTVGIDYTIDSAQFVFPPGSQQSTGGFNIGDTPLQLSAGLTGSATGSVTAHLIPKLNVGIDAINGAVSANVFLELDASATLHLNAAGAASSTTTTSRRRELASTQIERGLRLLTPASLNRRAPQSDSADDGSDDSSDNSQDNSGDDSVDTGDDSSDDTGNDDSTDSNDDSADSTSDDGSDNASADDSGLTDPSTDDSSDTADANDATDPSTDDSSDAASANDATDPSTDGSSGAADANDATDPSTDDSSDTAGANDATDPSTDDSSGAADANDATDSTDSTDTDSADNTGSTDSADTSTAASNANVDEVNATTSSSSAGGCVELDGGLDVSVGADGSFFGLFDANTKLSLFNKDFEIVTKCFGDQAGASRRDLSNSRLRRSASSGHLFSPWRKTGLSTVKRDALSCLAANVEDLVLQSIVDETVSASTITVK